MVIPTHLTGTMWPNYPGAELVDEGLTPETSALESLHILWPNYLINRRPVGSVGRVPDYRAGGRRFKPQLDQHSGSLNN